MESRKKLQTMCEWSIDGNDLRFTDRLGSGKTAKVYKGLYHGEEVAIKVLKPVIEEKQIRDFKKELDVMRCVVVVVVVVVVAAVVAAAEYRRHVWTHSRTHLRTRTVPSSPSTLSSSTAAV